MKNIINTLSRTSYAVLGRALLLFVSGSMAVSGIGLTAMYLVKHIDTQSPEIIQLKCMTGITHPACPQTNAKINALEGQIKDLEAKRSDLEGKLSNLKAVEETVDTITLFKSYDLPMSIGKTVVVGTRYSKLIDAEPKPHYYCYIGVGNTLFNFNGGVRKQFTFYNSDDGDIRISDKAQKALKLTATHIAFAKSVCKPTLIKEAK